jgi:hypothetical protein
MRCCLAWGPLLMLVTLYLGSLLPAWGQRPYIRQFDQGAVLTTAGDTIKGRIEFQQHADQLIVFCQDGTIRALSPARIRLFAVHAERQYYLPYGQGLVQGSFLGKHSELTTSLPSFLLDSTTVFLFRAYPWREPGPGGRSYPSIVFFEQLSNGPYLLLRRQQLFAHLVDAFYIRDPQGRITALRHPKKDLLALFSTQARQLEAFAKQHQFLFSDAYQLALLVAHANTLLP